MKKFILVLVMMVIGFSAFGQVASDSNGNDWADWSYEFKTGYMFGYLSANDAVWSWTYWTTDASTGDEEMAEFLRLIYEYPGETVDSLIAGVNSYYARYPEYIEDKIHDVIMYNCDKDWWNWDEETSYTDDVVEEEFEA